MIASVVSDRAMILTFLLLGRNTLAKEGTVLAGRGGILSDHVSL